MFELLDVGAAGQPPPVWNASDVPAGHTISLVTDKNTPKPWFEIDSSGDASRVSVAISFVDVRATAAWSAPSRLYNGRTGTL